MTCGIYLLKFTNTSKVYIGQSIDIEKRFLIHTSKLRRQIHTEKLQKAYNQYGEPRLVILVEASKEELDSLEEEAFEIYDSINNGFNSSIKAGGGCWLYGEDAGNSTYSNIQIEEAFLLRATKPELLAKDIAKFTGVSKETIDAITSGKVHQWLEQKYPAEYFQLMKQKENTLRFGKGKTLKDRGIVYPPIMSPEGTEYVVENTNQFAKQHNLNNAHLVQVLRGREAQHKGWKLRIE